MRHNARRYTRLPANAYEQRRLLIWLLERSEEVEQEGTAEQKELLASLGVRLNPKAFYDAEEPTQAQSVAHSKLLANLERRGFIERSAEQYTPHARLTPIGHTEAIRLQAEAARASASKQARWREYDITRPLRKFRAKARAFQRFAELDNRWEVVKKVQALISEVDAQILEGEHINRDVPAAEHAAMHSEAQIDWGMAMSVLIDEGFDFMLWEIVKNYHNHK